MADAEFGSSNEASVYYVEYAINEGVDGILLSPSSDQILPTVCRLCQDAGVYWGIYFRSIEDEEFEKNAKARHIILETSVKMKKIWDIISQKKQLIWDIRSSELYQLFNGIQQAKEESREYKKQ